MVAVGTLSRPSQAVAEPSVCVHHRASWRLCVQRQSRAFLDRSVQRRSVTSCTLLGSLIPPVTVFRYCITVSLDGELPAACNSLRSVSHCLNVNNGFVLVSAGDSAWQTSHEVLPCAPSCWQGFLCATLSGSRSMTTNLRRASTVTSCRRFFQQITCASCRSAAPYRDRFAGWPKTFFTSSVSNSGLITLAHVLNPIVNQSCHELWTGVHIPRDPVGLPADTFLASLDSR